MSKRGATPPTPKLFTRRPKADELLFVPLGGSGEIGMNLNLYGTAGKWLMLDLGMTFADERQPGIDLILPDPTFIEDRRDDLIAIVLTHAHEDHIGAVPYLWSRLQCPIYATPFTAALVRRKLAEAGLEREVELNILPMNGKVELGPFACELITLTHSIPEPNAVAIHTGFGTVLHTGDWKIDPEPLVGATTDRKRLEELGTSGVLAMVCDSTNVFSPGTSGSEAAVRESLIELIGPLEGRVAVTTFASNVARMSSIAVAAAEADRHLVLVGRSMHRVVEAAKETGYLADFPPVLGEDEAGYLPKDKVLYMCTGSQGEPRGAMARIARGEHRHISLTRGDTAIFSSKIIPGNELTLGDVHNQLASAGVQVITEKGNFIHVSGHPNRDELAAMYAWVRPQISVPVHGEPRHLVEHAAFAKTLQVRHAPIIKNGDVLRLAPGAPDIIGEVEAGRLAVDGDLIVEVDDPAIVARRKMAFAGHIVVTLVVDAKGKAVTEPEVVIAGLAEEEDGDLAAEIAEAVKAALPRGRTDIDSLTEAARQAARRAANRITGRKPVTDVQVIRLPG
ncbi:ribonuclease J [Oleomonas cavernae]|uniref:Ribonuclease J n=1 Tax=Oleomonas cavernae TaxID=2320859 RepID=A0A418WBU9_9PROT|nr:ribonuclease J [Oleomonas cavernae]RJF87454.1 ribonuclease J [Oleomonas cavernae]